jgi:hypothetical protein
VAASIARFINQCLLQVLEHNFIERRASGPVLEEMAKGTVSYDILEM